MPRSSISCVVLAFCLLSSLSLLATAAPITNAERLKRGLPLEKPNGFIVRLVNGVTRTLPQGVSKVRWATRPSSAPAPSKEGCIKVDGLDGGDAFVGKTLSWSGTYPLTHNKTDCLLVKFDSSKTSTPAGLQNNGNTTFPWLGLAAGKAVGGETKLAPGSDAAVLLVGVTTQTNTYSPPEAVEDSLGKPYLGSETNLWTLTTSTKELLAKWVNPNGSLAKTVVFFYVKDGDFFGLTSDLAAFNAEFPDAVGTKVTFTFEA